MTGRTRTRLTAAVQLTVHGEAAATCARAVDDVTLGVGVKARVIHRVTVPSNQPH